ncbi:MAG: DegT/DnrJ/EryC1/StrS family aminotransferase [Candidatus Bipolaricaulaceae bacterium]
MRQRLAIAGGRPTVPEGLKVRWPLISREDKEAAMRTLDEEVLHGPYVPEVTALERDFAAYIGQRYCIATNSGTAALHMALAAAGIGPGDEVIVPAFTFLATASAVLHHNAVPVFVDIDPRTFNIDPGRIPERISPRTKAIVPVHIHGLPADMDAILAIARQHKLVVVEDACQAPGAEYKGVKVGNFGDLAAFSLNVTKNLPGIEGGLLVTGSKEYRDSANMLRMFGEDIRAGEVRRYNAYGMGWMYRTHGMPAAIARRQLRRLDSYNATAQRNAAYLTEQLADLPGIVPPHVPADRTSVFHKYRVRLDPRAVGLDVDREAFRGAVADALRAEGVDVVRWQTRPVPAQTLFQLKEGYGKGCPWSCLHYGREISYRAEDYPETVRLLADSLVICSEAYPIYAQPLELMRRYVDGICKVLDHIEEVVDRSRAPAKPAAKNRARRAAVPARRRSR